MLAALLVRITSQFPHAGRGLRWLRKHRKTRRTLIIVFFHLLGALTSIHAILSVRTAQGAVAWAVSLNTVPYLAVPAYWVFGRSNFEGYVVLRRNAENELSGAERQLKGELLAMRPQPGTEPESAKLLEKLAKLPVTQGNQIELLINGDATFASIFEGIEQARDYVLVEFYIIHDDGLGRRLKEALLAKARSGVRCYVIYDELGSHKLPATYIDELRNGGVDIRPFNTRKGHTNRFQLNFRNHRKIVVVDGHTAFVGGHNVGDEYVGKDPEYGAWRDTHVKAEGPVVQCVQIAWAEDWNWAAGVMPELNWKPAPAPGNGGLAFCLPSGPADEFETCTLFFLHAINTAKKRVWIASPFFVPDEQIISAIQLAALRGVDVRILLSVNPDQLHIYLSSFTFLPALEKPGVQMWRYHAGYLHEKAILVDEVCGIGTANFDNRSFRLNFEIMLLFSEPAVVREAEAMFAADFSRSKRTTAADFTERPWWFRFAARTSRLMAPIQ
jgi:cardiolipin synthase